MSLSAFDIEEAVGLWWKAGCKMQRSSWTGKGVEVLRGCHADVAAVGKLSSAKPCALSWASALPARSRGAGSSASRSSQAERGVFSLGGSERFGLTPQTHSLTFS